MWIAIVNGFFAILFVVGIWADFAAIGKVNGGIGAVDLVDLAIIVALIVGIVSEVFRLRFAAPLNVGVYVAMALLVCVEVGGSLIARPQQDSLALVGIFVALLVLIGMSNLLLYRGVSPIRQSRDL